MNNKLHESWNNLESIQEEIRALYDALLVADQDFGLGSIYERYTILQTVNRYLIIKICSYEEEVKRYFLKEYDQLNNTQLIQQFGPWLSFNKIFNQYDFKKVRDTLFAHNNRIRVNRDYPLMNAVNVDEINLPERPDTFGLIAKQTAFLNKELFKLI